MPQTTVLAPFGKTIAGRLRRGTTGGRVRGGMNRGNGKNNSTIVSSKVGVPHGYDHHYQADDGGDDNDSADYHNAEY